MTTNAPSLVSFYEMLCYRRTIMFDPQHGRDSVCPPFSLLSRFIFHVISKLPSGWGNTRQRLLSNCFPQNESATNFILYSLFCLGCPLSRVFEPSWVFYFIFFFNSLFIFPLLPRLLPFWEFSNLTGWLQIHTDDESLSCLTADKTMITWCWWY